MNIVLRFFLVLLPGICLCFTPYIPTSGWTYYIEANREQVWPNCAFRFFSYPQSCDSIDLWNAAGINQQLTFVQSPFGNMTFYLKTSCGRYLSYPGDCNLHTVDTWPDAGVNQAFTFVPSSTGPFQYSIQTYGRQSCDFKWLSFPVPCTTNKPDTLDLWNAVGREQTFRIHPVKASSPISQTWNSATACADPFAWYSKSSDSFHVVCTGATLDLLSSSTMGPNAILNYVGPTINTSNLPAWARSGDRWAPENIELTQFNPVLNFIFFSDGQSSDGKHRVGWAYSTQGATPSKWEHFSPNFMNLGMTTSGEIDEHVFYDESSKKYYLIWKTDDNSIGMKYTRIWGQEISFTATSVTLVGSRVQILDSTGLWWSNSWVAGGSLIEGPEIIQYGGYYYLFFASGQYCQDSYMEGVARSKSVLGPYEKMQIPFLSTGIVGVSKGQKLIGPGHASYVKDKSNSWYVVFHASTSTGGTCVRYPFISKLSFSGDLWPYVDY